jgi:hypothetical protein
MISSKSKYECELLEITGFVLILLICYFQIRIIQQRFNLFVKTHKILHFLWIYVSI